MSAILKRVSDQAPRRILTARYSDRGLYPPGAHRPGRSRADRVHRVVRGSRGPSARDRNLHRAARTDPARRGARLAGTTLRTDSVWTRRHSARDRIRACGSDPAMEEERLKAILESLLFAAGEPVSVGPPGGGAGERPAGRDPRRAGRDGRGLRRGAAESRWKKSRAAISCARRKNTRSTSASCWPRGRRG